MNAATFKCQLNRHPTCWCHAFQLGAVLTLAAFQHGAQLQIDCDAALGMLASKIHTSQEALTCESCISHIHATIAPRRAASTRAVHTNHFSTWLQYPLRTLTSPFCPSCGSSSVSGSWHCSSISSGQRSTSCPQQDNPQHQIRITGCL